MTPAVYVAIIAAAITAVSLVFTIYRETRAKSKKLAWKTIYNTGILLQMSKKHLSQLSIKWGGDDLREPRVVGIELINTGRVELRTDDISLPITVGIVDGRIVSAEVELRPQGASSAKSMTIARQDDDAVEAAALLLNPGDSLVFELFVDGGTADPTLTMQAAGFRLHELSRASVLDQLDALIPPSFSATVARTVLRVFSP